MFKSRVAYIACLRFLRQQKHHCRPLHLPLRIYLKQIKTYQPNLITITKLNKKNISLVINTSEGKNSIADSFSLRRTSLINKVPYFTTIPAANACLDSIEALKKYPIKVRALQDL